MTRCRIGHSRLTHSYLLNNDHDERQEGIPCNLKIPKYFAYLRIGQESSCLHIFQSFDSERT